MPIYALKQDSWHPWVWSIQGRVLSNLENNSNLTLKGLMEVRQCLILHWWHWQYFHTTHIHTHTPFTYCTGLPSTPLRYIRTASKKSVTFFQQHNPLQYNISNTHRFADMHYQTAIHMSMWKHNTALVHARFEWVGVWVCVGGCACIWI